MGERKKVEGTWITFKYRGYTESGKTQIWAVEAKADGALLGQMKWFSQWRRYAFYPEPDMVFEENCLRAIAAFCETVTRTKRTEARHG